MRIVMISKKRERLTKSQSDSHLWSISQIAGTRKEDDGNYAQGVWSKSYGWSKSRGDRSKNLRFSLTQNNWSNSGRERSQRVLVEKQHMLDSTLGVVR